MRVGWCPRGKHANKAKFFAESSEKFGHKSCVLSKKSHRNCDIIVGYGNFIPTVEEHQIFINIHAGYLSRPEYHRISIGGYHPGEYIMDVNHSNDRLQAHNVEIKPWKRAGDYVLVCTVSKFNMELFRLKWPEDIGKTMSFIKEFTNRKLILRDRKERWDSPLSDLFENAWAMVTWSSNCAVEALLAGIPCFLRAGAAASPMCLTDLSRLDNPYYPENRQQWLQNLAYHQFYIHEIMDGTAWDIVMTNTLKRGCIIR